MIGCSQVTQDNLYKNFKSVINKRIINLTQNYMELLQTPQYLLDHCFCFSLKELLLLFFVFYEIGYYFGRKNKKRKTSFQNQSNNLLLMSSQLQIRSEQPAEAQKTQKQVHQQSMKLVRQSDEIPFQVLEQSIKGQSKSSQKQNSYVHKSDDQLSRDFLCEKINVQGKKIQSRGIFHMTVQKAENPKFMRKIEKHQIITDYEIQQTNKQNGQLIPFGSKQFFQFSDDNAILQISTYQNFKVQKYPVIQKRLIKTHQFTQYDQNNKANIPMSPSLCENGKFTKFFKNPKKIGQGAFGIVYSVKNIFEGKEYAIKKLFIRSGLGKITMETILNESIKEVNIISQYSHPNIIRFHTCWLQIANLNEAITFNKTHFKQRLEEDISIFQAGSQPNFKKKNSGQECLQISYISSQANSGFSFENQSRNTILSSSRKKNNKGQPISQLAPMIEQQNKLEEDQKQKGYSDMVPVFALYIQMQLCPQGSLDKYLQRRKSLNRNFAFLVINQLLRGVGHLHSNGLVHRDLKPGNILIHKKQRLIKIGDFGLSAKINQQIQYGKIGTPSYIAPEIIQKRPIKKQDLHLIDVYSIGVIYFELLNLFNRATKHEKMQKITKLKQSKIQLPGQFKLQKKVIKMMTKSWSRLAVTQIFQLEQYKELSRIVQKDGQILRSWQNISGLDAQHQQN